MLKIFAYQKKDRILEGLKKEWLTFLNPEEKEKVVSFKKEADRETALISRVWLKKILADELGLKPDEINLSFNRYGRPFLEKETIDFNVSHSGDWIVWVLAREGRVGIDVEKIKTVEESLADDCFTKEERTYIYSSGEFDLDKFFELWTLKESFIKAEGRGLSCHLKDFYFQLEDKIKVYEEFTKENWFFQHYEISPSYKLALCSSQKDFPKEITFLN